MDVVNVVDDDVAVAVVVAVVAVAVVAVVVVADEAMAPCGHPLPENVS